MSLTDTAPAPAKAVTPILVDGPGSEPVEILIVDDDPPSCRLMSRALQGIGFECRVANGGEEGLRMVHEKLPTIVLLDLDMPKMNGADVIARLRGDEAPEITHLPVIVMTGHWDDTNEIRCLEAGAEDFVTKPINIAVLRVRINTQLRTLALRRELARRLAECEHMRGQIAAGAQV